MASSDQSKNQNNSGGSDGCCSLFCSEFSHPLFDTKDPNGKTIDMVASFNTKCHPVIKFIKFCFLFLTIFPFAYDWVKYEHPEFYMSYLTHWTHFCSILYMTFSFLLSLGIDNEKILRGAWVLFAIASSFKIMITLLFWGLEYDSESHELDFGNLMKHGGVMLIIFIDGLIIGRIPLRVKNWYPVFVFSVLYSGWVVLHAYVVMHNPWTADDDDYDEKPLYSVLDFYKEPVSAGILLFIIVFVISPVLFLFLRSVSVCRRKYIEEEEQQQPEQEESEREETNGDEEMAQVY